MSHPHNCRCTGCQKADEFFSGFEPKTLKIDHIGPTAALQTRVRELEQERVTDDIVISGLKLAAENLGAQLQTVTQEREEWRGNYQTLLDDGVEMRKIAAQLQARNSELVDALCMLYDRYEDGPPCTENGDEYGSPLGNCVQLDAEEEDQILKLIPAERKKP